MDGGCSTVRQRFCGQLSISCRETRYGNRYHSARNYPENVPDCNGRSTVFDGVAYLPDEEGSRDTCILEADGSEGIYIAELDLKQLRDYRKSEVHGNAYRHPQKYGILIDTKVEEPFIREDYRR